LGSNGIQTASKTSLLRPFQLLETRTAVDQKYATQKNLSSVGDEYVKQIVQTQIGHGFHPISDGEYRRHMLWYDQIPTFEHHINKSRGTFFPDL
jgi:methionine synthase II (cobalamin-independent)